MPTDVSTGLANLAARPGSRNPINVLELSLIRVAVFLVMMLIQITVVMAGIDESVRVEPSILRVLDSIAPNTRLIFQAKRGQEIVLLGDYLDMSLYGIDESYNTNWSWTPKSSKIRFAGIAGVQMSGKGIGECLVGNRTLPNDIFRYSFSDGRTRDSLLIPIPKPAYHIIQNLDANGSIIAFTALVQTHTRDTLYAYVVDTASGWNSIWKAPVASDGVRISESAIRIVDTSVVVYWQEQINSKDYRIRVMVKGLHSEVEVQSVTLSDVGDHRYQTQFIEVDEADSSVVIFARVTSRNEPRWGVQYWRYNIVSGELNSVTDFLPKHTYLTVSDAMISSDRKVVAVGSIVDVDPTTLQVMQFTSRGFICEYDSAPTMKRLLSMQDQQPSSLSSLFQDQGKLFVLGQGVDQSHFIARIDEDRITSVSPSQLGDHKALQHVGWYDFLGRSLLRPEGSTVIEVMQCSPGCYHSKLLWLH